MYWSLQEKLWNSRSALLVLYHRSASMFRTHNFYYSTSETIGRQSVTSHQNKSSSIRQLLSKTRLKLLAMLTQPEIELTQVPISARDAKHRTGNRGTNGGGILKRDGMPKMSLNSIDFLTTLIHYTENCIQHELRKNRTSKCKHERVF